MICLKGKKISNYLFQSEKVTLPLEASKYLDTLPLYKECFVLLKKLNNNNYKLLKFIFYGNNY